MSYYVLVNEALDAGSPYPSKKAAEDALAKRQAKDSAVDNPIQYEYKVLSEVKK